MHQELSRPAPQQRAWAALLAVVFMLTAYRGWVIVHTALPLYMDEAQYWLWSRTPDWGYFSKPPMVAWIIRAFGALGDSELAVRAGTLALHAGTALLVFALGRRMFDVRTALASAMLFISLPLVGFNSLFMTTDAPLFFFWGLAAWAFWHALERDWPRDWLLLGCALGLGLLSKYSMVLFLPCAALALCLPPYRRHWRNPGLYASVLLALLVLAPNLWWNARMDFVTLRHTAEISQLERNLFHPARLAEFIGAQFLCMGPLGFALLVGALGSRAVWRERRLAFLAALTLPFLAAIALQALLARAHANWAAPAYFGASLLVGARLMQAPEPRMRWCLAMVLVNLALLSAFYHYHGMARALGVTLTQQRDPYARVLGWPEAGAAVGSVLALHPGTRLATVDRGEFALLSYYARPHANPPRIWNPEHARSHHFQLTADLDQDPGANVIYASTHPMNEDAAHSFARWRVLGTISVKLYPDHRLLLYLYRGDQFLGYAPARHGGGSGQARLLAARPSAGDAGSFGVGTP